MSSDSKPDQTEQPDDTDKGEAAGSKPTAHMLLAEGEYDAVILDFDPPELTRGDRSYHHVRMRVGMQNGTYVIHLFGFITAMYMLYKSRGYWIGKTIKVRAKHVVRDHGGEPVTFLDLQYNPSSLHG